MLHRDGRRGSGGGSGKKYSFGRYSFEKDAVLEGVVLEKNVVLERGRRVKAPPTIGLWEETKL